MAFTPKKIFPLDTKPGTGIGVSIPFSSPSVFNTTYYTKDSIRNNLLNFLLTNPGERYLNPDFGLDLRKFIFEQITSDNLSFLKQDIQSRINTQFPNINITSLEVMEYPDTNEIRILLQYTIPNTGINDQIDITL